MSVVVQPDETNESYHAPDGHMSSSMLRTLAVSPAVFYAEHVVGAIEREETPAMKLGTALHTLALEPHRFREEYIAPPPELPSDRRLKEVKAWEASVDPRLTVLSRGDMDLVRGMHAGMLKNPTVYMMLAGPGKVEHSIRWRDKLDVACKVRPDKLIMGKVNICMDIKTLPLCTVRSFEQSLGEYYYDLQAAFYLRGLKHHYGGEWRFVFAVVEKHAAHRCRIFELEDDSMNAAEEKVAELLKEYKKRRDEGDWLDPQQNDVVKVRTPFYRLAGYENE